MKVFAKPIVVHRHIDFHDGVNMFLGEFLGTAILLFIGCEAAITDKSILAHIPSVDPVRKSLTFGFAVLIAIQCFAHISGAHINPALSWAAVLLGHLQLSLLPVYVVAQICGAIFGFGAIVINTPVEALKYNSTDPGLCSPRINPSITILQGFASEFLFTLILTLVCGAVWDSRNAKNSDSLSLRFGFSIAGLAMMGGPYTSCNMNPARSFAPALLNWYWKDHWLFWAAPILASTVGALLYRFQFSNETPYEIPETVPANTEAAP